MGLTRGLVPWCRLCLWEAAIVSGLLGLHPVVSQTWKVSKLLNVLVCPARQGSLPHPQRWPSRPSEWSWPSENHMLVTSQAGTEAQPLTPSVLLLSLRWWSGSIYKTCGCYELLLLVRRIGNVRISRLPFKYSNSCTRSIWLELLFFRSDVFQCASLNSKSTSGLNFENANCILTECEKWRKLS